MAPKYNAFSTFIKHHQQQEKSEGKRTSFKELADKLADTWRSMPIEEKNKYKILSNKYNKDTKKYVKPEQVINTFNNSDNYWKMKSDIKKMFESINTTELMSRKFILVHVNCHTHLEEQYYFPAEIAALEFNLADGVTRRYHQIIGISNIYPRGFAGRMRQYSTNFHQIHCFEELWDNYANILMEFINFLTNETEGTIDLSKHQLNLPYMFTIESEVGTDMMKMKNGLERLFATALPECAEHAKSVFKMGSTEQLLHEIITKLNIHVHPKTLTSPRLAKSVHDILESDMYGWGLGCTYHHLREIEYKCSRARILQWLSNICKYVSEFTDLELIPGKHVAAMLKDGSRRIFDSPNALKSITDDYNVIIDKFNLLELYDDDMRFDYEAAGNLESTTSSILDESGYQVESKKSDIKF